MKENIKYYVVKQKALPEVLLKVAEANRLIENQNISIADATEKVGISRSSYYKYKDDIFPFRDNSKGKTITFVLSMEDEPGLLSVVLKKVAEFKANILTILRRFLLMALLLLRLVLRYFQRQVMLL